MIQDLSTLVVIGLNRSLDKMKRFIKGYSGNKLNALDKPQKDMNGCYSDADCSDGKTCATVKSEYPSSCAGKW